MVKANELRIGNLVYLDLKEQYLKTIVELKHYMASVKYIRTDTGEPHQSMVDYERLEPIPLTQEWLLKFGFCRYGNSQNKFLSKRVNGLRLIIRMDMFDSNRFFFVMNQNWIIDIKSVHHLQNLFFSLTGKELVFSETAA